MGGRSGKTAHAVARARLPCQDRQQRPQAARPGWGAPRRHGPGDGWRHRRSGKRIEIRRRRRSRCCCWNRQGRMADQWGAPRSQFRRQPRRRHRRSGGAIIATSGDAGDQAEDARGACWAQGKWRSSTDSDALLSDRRGFHAHKRSSGSWIRPHRAIGARRVAQRGSGPRHPSPDRRRYRACQG